MLLLDQVPPARESVKVSGFTVTQAFTDPSIAGITGAVFTNTFAVDDAEHPLLDTV